MTSSDDNPVNRLGGGGDPKTRVIRASKTPSRLNRAATDTDPIEGTIPIDDTSAPIAPAPSPAPAPASGGSQEEAKTAVLGRSQPAPQPAPPPAPAPQPAGMQPPPDLPPPPPSPSPAAPGSDTPPEDSWLVTNVPDTDSDANQAPASDPAAAGAAAMAAPTPRMPAGSDGERTRIVGRPARLQAADETKPAVTGGKEASEPDDAGDVSDQPISPVVGWLVVLDGPGRGAFRPIEVGMNSVGRGANQRIRINFGDDTISREEHAYVVYDHEERIFYVQHGGKANLVRLNDKPVLNTTELKSGDRIRLGRTALQFVPFCGENFDWSDE